MGKYLALQIITGRLRYSAVVEKYSKYKTVIDHVITEKGYEIDAKGDCVLTKNI